MSSMNETAALVAEYQAEYTVQYIGIATTVLLLYDIIICLDQEIELVWRKAASFASVLYFLNRYPVPISTLLALVTISPVSNESCAGLVWSGHVLALLSYLGPALFAALRVYAMTGKNKTLSGITLILSLATFLEELIDAYHFPPTNAPPPVNCTTFGSFDPRIELVLTLAGRVPAILADCLVIGITWRKSYRTLVLRAATDDTDQPSLHQVFLMNGSVYFCVFLSLNVLDITLELLQITLPEVLGQGNYIAGFIYPINSLLTSRFLLDLRAVNKKLSNPGETSVSAGSLQFAGADILSGEPQPFFSFAEDLDAHGSECDDDARDDVDGEGSPVGVSGSDIDEVEARG
ncbi:hypothetical protein OH77DRAFT_1430171 [Trametes cingulata]|nr:hypothetical protein OH77DRAFT_1430171 [Trametes cingulata]